MTIKLLLKGMALAVISVLALSPVAVASCVGLYNASTTTSWANFGSLTLKDYVGMRNRTASTVNAQFGYADPGLGQVTLCSIAPGWSCEGAAEAGFDNANDYNRKRSSGGSANVDFYTCDTLAEAQDDGGDDGAE